MKHYDIVINGSGLVGASLALALAPYSFKIAVIDKQPNTGADKKTLEDKEALDARAIALTLQSIQILKNINVFECLKDEITPINTVHVSMQGKFGVTRLRASDQALPYSLPYLGVVIDADRLNQILNEQMKRHDIDQYRGSELVTCGPMNRSTQINEQKNAQKNEQTKDPINTRWQLSLNTGETFTTELLVGADGKDSFLRKRFAIPSIEEHYPSSALIANVALQGSHLNYAYERFLNQGSLAFLPFGEQQVKSVLILNNENLDELFNLEPKAYLAYLQNLFGFRLGKLKILGKRVRFPLSRVSATQVYGPGFVLIGNAANTLHPIAAQGFNLALRDVAALLETVLNAQKSKVTLGDVQLLSEFAKKRIPDHQETVWFTNTLEKNRNMTHAGMICAELFPTFKQQLLKRALGYRDNTSRLCQGELYVR